MTECVRALNTVKQSPVGGPPGLTIATRITVELLMTDDADHGPPPEEALKAARDAFLAFLAGDTEALKDAKARLLPHLPEGVDLTEYAKALLYHVGANSNELSAKRAERAGDERNARHARKAAEQQRATAVRAWNRATRSVRVRSAAAQLPRAHARRRAQRARRGPSITTRIADSPSTPSSDDDEDDPALAAGRRSLRPGGDR
ncbi:MAG: hypothetical protein ACYTHK_07195 [Planctomycetota bacterium]